MFFSSFMELFVYFIVLILIVVVWKFIIKPFYLIKAYPIPGPERTSIIFGNLREILKEEPQEPGVRWSNIYSSPLIRYFVGPTMRILITDADVAKQVLNDQNTFTKKLPDYEDFLSQVTGYSLLTTSNIDLHRKQRGLCNPAFKYEYILDFIPMFAEQTKKLISKWEQINKTSETGESLIEITEDLSALTLDIIGLGGFNCEFDSLLNNSTKSLAYTYTQLMGTFKPTLFMILPYYDKLPTQRHRKRQQILQSINQAVSQIITLRRKEPKMGVIDLLGILLKAKDSNTGVTLTDQELKDLCLTFLVAGHETTSMLLTWSLYCFAKYPEVQEKCRKEVFSLLGNNPPTKENIGELKYLSNTLNEVLRLYPPVPMVKRNTEKDIVLAGYTVPKGTHVIISQVVLQRCKKHWENPDDFNPDRWDSKVNHSNWFLPFIDGPRNCIGKKFAQVEAMVILVGILQNFSFRISEAHPFRKRQIVSLRPDPGLTMHVKKIL